MSALYLHIPFCGSRCHYCDFYSQCDRSRESAFVEALLLEMQQRQGEANAPLDSIYLGGGTPSQLSPDSLQRIFEAIDKHFCIAPQAEITFEANPDDLNPPYLNAISTLPINRISMGVQSFDDAELRFLGRRHSSQQAKDAVAAIRQIGIENISLDLIYGIPTQTLERWEQSLEACLALAPKHISAYHLIYEEGTQLTRLRKEKKIEEVDEELSLKLFDLLIDRLAAAQYEQYEISNFAQTDYRSRHNSKYWQGLPYIGLGPSAHSYDGAQTRSYNPPSIEAYIQGMKAGRDIRQLEILSPTDRYNELILTSLRRSEGIDLERLAADFGEESLSHCLGQAQCFIDRGLLIKSPSRLALSRQGLFLSDNIMAELFRC